MKLKILGKGDVGKVEYMQGTMIPNTNYKVFLVREKNSNELFAMKVLNKKVSSRGVILRDLM